MARHMAIRLLIPLQMKHVSGYLVIFIISEIEGGFLTALYKAFSSLFYNINRVKS
jgi:hypothetical protein